MPRTMLLTIATRESRLALWQAEHVKTLLQQQGHAAALLGMTTRGDQTAKIGRASCRERV